MIIQNVKKKSVILKILIALYAFSENPLIEGSGGIVAAFFAVAVCGVFLKVQDSNLQKNRWLSAFSCFFGICSVIGKSYLELGNWDYIFGGGLRFLLALIVIVGYMYLFKNTVIFVADVLIRNELKLGFINMGGGEHTFLYPFLALMLMTLPYIIVFFPGTLHSDGYVQLSQYLGINELTGHHPVLVTMLMGKCFSIGRNFFHSDNIGLFLYVGPQLLVQNIVFAYTIRFLSKMGTPVVVRWFALLFYGVFPMFPMWGCTFVKDTGYYICFVLFVVECIQVFWGAQKVCWWQWLTFLGGIIGMGLYRNEGRYIVIVTLIIAGIANLKKWKYALVGSCVCIVSILMIENVYMPLRGVEQGSVGEMLSVPLQQTARYLSEKRDELSADEIEEFSTYFRDGAYELAENYNPEVSDPVKDRFLIRTKGDALDSYFSVWFKCLLKEPDIYLQAFLNQIYGYFYPDKEHFWDSVCCFEMLYGQEWADQCVDVGFVIKNTTCRNVIEKITMFLYDMPLIGLLFRPAFYVYAVFGSIFYLLYKKKYKEIFVLVPSLLVVMVSLVSPVNAYLRYLLPIIALLPVNIAWCLEKKQENE